MITEQIRHTLESILRVVSFSEFMTCIVQLFIILCRDTILLVPIETVYQGNRK